MLNESKSNGFIFCQTKNDKSNQIIELFKLIEGELKTNNDSLSICERLSEISNIVENENQDFDLLATLKIPQIFYNLIIIQKEI